MIRSTTKRLRGLALIRDDDIPLYRQIYEHLRTAIRTGQLRPGDRLPSTRGLAERFGTARGLRRRIDVGRDCCWDSLTSPSRMRSTSASGSII